MELELRRDTVNCYELALDATVCQEETRDILRILEAEGQAYLTNKQVRDGAVSVTGQARACVFYLPEAGEEVRRMEVDLPFTCQADAPALTGQGSALAFPRVRWCEARLLNPRKILVRLELAVEVQAWQPSQLELCSGAAEDGENGVRQLLTEHGADVVIAVQEKPFTFSEDIDLGFSDGEVLTLRGEPRCAESKLIGSKLIFKGALELEALVRDGGELKTVRQSLAFSQIMEVAGVGEDSRCQVRAALSELRLEDLEGGSIGTVTAELLAQAVVREHRPVTILRDLYSTSCRTETRMETYRLHRVMEQGERAVPVRELMETTTPVRAVPCCWAQVGEVARGTEGEQTVLTAQVRFTALYLDDAGQLQGVEKSLSVQSRCESAAGTCQCWCAQPRELYVIPAAGGLEVRFTLDFHSFITADDQVQGVCGADLGEERTAGDGGQPSIVLRMSAPGEGLWDIAKAYGTTEEEISQANELEDGQLPAGRMLLIPRVR